MRKFCVKMRKFRTKNIAAIGPLRDSCWLIITVEHMHCELTDRNWKRWLKKSNSLQTFITVKEEKLFIWHNKTSNIALSEQRIPLVLLEQLIIAAIKLMVFTIFSHFREVLLRFCFIYFHKNCEISRKSLRNATANFRIFRETFRSLKPLIRISTRLPV